MAEGLIIKKIQACAFLLTASFSAYAMEERWAKLMQMIEEDAKTQGQQLPDSYEQSFKKWYERVQEIKRQKAVKEKWEEIAVLLKELEAGDQKKK